MYGGLGNTATSSAAQLSRVMIDYWVSFATSLNPNDGHGVSRSSIFTAHRKPAIETLTIYVQVLSGSNILPSTR